MNILTTLKLSINSLYYLFILGSLYWIIAPFFDGTDFYSGQEVFFLLILFPLTHLLVMFMILYNLRKFVLLAEAGTPLQEKTRTYLNRAGKFSLLYGFIGIQKAFGLITFWQSQDLSSQSSVLVWELSWSMIAPFYSFLIGLFFIYLSKVLEYSDRIKQENMLTI